MLCLDLRKAARGEQSLCMTVMSLLVAERPSWQPYLRQNMGIMVLQMSRSIRGLKPPV